MENITESVVRDAHGHYRKGNTIYGECEVCDAKDVVITCHYGNMWFCSECWDKEVKHKESNITEVTQVNTLHKVNQDVILASKEIDNSIQVRPEIFNAATIALIDIKKAIDDNPAITNKPYTVAETVMERFKHYQTVIFSAREQLIDAENNIKAIQVFLNQMANTLRQEEREKLKIQDINYQPGRVKPAVKQIKTIGTKKSGKLDKVELRKYASQLGVSEFTLQMICVQKGITVETAANILRKSIEDSKPKSDTPKLDIPKVNTFELCDNCKIQTTHNSDGMCEICGK